MGAKSRKVVAKLLQSCRKIVAKCRTLRFAQCPVVLMLATYKGSHALTKYLATPRGSLASCPKCRKLSQSCRKVIAKLSQSHTKVVAKCRKVSQSCCKVIAKCRQVVAKCCTLSQSDEKCRRVSQSRRKQSCREVAAKLSQSFREVVAEFVAEFVAKLSQSVSQQSQTIFPFLAAFGIFVPPPLSSAERAASSSAIADRQSPL